MKRIFLCLFVCMLILVSCSQEPEEKVVPPETVSVGNVLSDISEPVLAGSQTTVTLSGLKKGELYGIYAAAGVSRSLEPESGTSSGLIPAGNTGAYLFLADKNGDLTFTGMDAGISDIGTLRFVNYDLDKTDGVFTINSKNDAPLFTAADGTEFYEEYYEIPLDGIESGDVAVLSINKSQNVLHRATYNGVVTENEVKGSDAPENCGVMDLSGRKSVRLISQMKLRLRESDNGGSAVRIALKNPVTLKKNEQSDLISPSIYRIKSSDSNEEYVLELTLDNGFGLYDFDTLINNSRPRYASGDNAGRIKNYIAPMSVEGNKILLYVGKLDQDFIFDFYKLYEFEDFEKEIIEESVGKIKLRPISEDERAKIVSINIDEYKEPLYIELTADDSLKLVIFTADNPEVLKGLRISLDFVEGESDDGLMCKSYSSRDDSRGYSQNILQQANEDKTFVYGLDEHVDYLVFEDLETPSENKIILKIEK